MTDASTTTGDVPADAVSAEPDEPQRQGTGWKTWLVFAFVVVVATVVRVPMLHRVFGGRKAFRQSQTAWAIRLYARHGIDLLHPPLPVLGPPWRLWLELPVPQAIASLIVHLGLTSTAAGRLLGLLSLQLTALLLFLLVRRLAGSRAALIAVLLLETVPLAAWFGADSLIEFPVTSLALGSVLALLLFLERGKWWWWILAAGCSALTFMIKVTTGTAWTVPLLVIAVVAARPDLRARWRRSAIGLLAAPGAGLVGEAWWAHYSTVHNNQSPFTKFQTFQSDWRGVIGTPHDRLVWAKYDVVIHRMGELMTGHALLYVAAVVLIAVAARHKAVLLALAAVPVVGAWVWFPLYVQHDYYPCAVLPAVAGVMGVAIDVAATGVVRRLAAGSSARLGSALTGAVSLVVTAGVLALAWTSTFGHAVRQDLAAHPKIPWESVVMSRHTPPQAKIIMLGCGWDSKYLYNADRWGLMYSRRGRPPLSPDYVTRTYQYVMSCEGRRMLEVLPQSLTYRRVAPGLYRIVAA